MMMVVMVVILWTENVRVLRVGRTFPRCKRDHELHPGFFCSCCRCGGPALALAAWVASVHTLVVLVASSDVPASGLCLVDGVDGFIAIATTYWMVPFRCRH